MLPYIVSSVSKRSPGLSQSSIDTEKGDAAERVRIACARIAAERNSTLTDLHLKYICGYRRTFVFQTLIKTPDETIDLFVKAGRNLSGSVREFVEREATLSTEIRRRFSATAHLDVIDVEAYYADLAVLATRTVPGVRLDQVIVSALRSRSTERIARATSAVESCGHWLRAFQRSWPREGTIDTQDLLIGIERQVNRIAANRPDLMSTERARLFTETTVRLAERLPIEDRACVTRHDDYAPWNVINDGDRIVVFDFPNVQPGPKYYDMYQFDSALASLQSKPFIPVRELQQLRRQFRAAFDTNANNSVDRDNFYAIQFGLVRLGAMLHLHRSKFPKSLIVKYRTNNEIENLTAICESVT